MINPSLLSGSIYEPCFGNMNVFLFVRIFSNLLSVLYVNMRIFMGLTCSNKRVNYSRFGRTVSFLGGVN